MGQFRLRSRLPATTCERAKNDRALKKEICENINKSIEKKVNEAFNQKKGNTYDQLLGQSEELAGFEMWQDLDYYSKRLKNAFKKYQASGDLIYAGKGKKSDSIFQKDNAKDEKDKYYTSKSSPLPVTVVCQGH